MLNTKSVLYALDDVCIIPAPYSKISSRKECNPYYGDKTLPIFASPMASIVSVDNLNVWIENGITPILPRTVDIETRMEYAYKGIWIAVSLNEFEHYFIKDIKSLKINKDTSLHILIDIANGHMAKLCNMITESKAMMRLEYPDLTYEIMAGNVAHPETYRNLALAGADYVRCSIGSGGCCITSSQLSLHYPLASLIDECYKIKDTYDLSAEIIADGGINSYNRAITALALGADYVMIGTMFGKCIESAAPIIAKSYKSDGTYDVINLTIDDTSYSVKSSDPYVYKNNEPLTYTPENEPIYRDIIKIIRNSPGYMYEFSKEIFGMSTRKAQTLIDKNAPKKTSEGITKIVPIEYTVKQWVENFTDYLRSVMSYCNKRELWDFVGEVETRIMSPIAAGSFNK